MKNIVVMLTVTSFFITLHSMQQPLNQQFETQQGKPRSKSMGDVPVYKKTIMKRLCSEENNVEKGINVKYPSQPLPRRMTTSDSQQLCQRQSPLIKSKKQQL